MADDIEDLLREVEEKYLPAEKEPAVKKIENLCISGRSNSDIISHEADDDLPDLLDEKLMMGGLRKKPSTRRSVSAKQLYCSAVKIKCFPVYLSGVVEDSDSKNVRPCSHLRCTGCDFRVGQFNHFKWRPGTDYLFLRNHMPEFDRVRVKLMAAKNLRAYACQCLFVTVKDVIDQARMSPEFTKWVCGGH